MVTIRTCPSYQEETISAALRQALADIGGLDAYARPGETVLLKVNLVMGKGPEAAVTTHPALVSALARLLIAHGCRVLIGDSPGGPFNAVMLRRVYHLTGMDRAAAASGAELSYSTETKTIS